MSERSVEQARDDQQPDERSAAPRQGAKAKKAYRKPELWKHEQLHGIGLGS